MAKDLHVATPDDHRFVVTPAAGGAISLRIKAVDRVRLACEIARCAEDIADYLAESPPDDPAVLQQERDALAMMRALAEALRECEALQ